MEINTASKLNKLCISVFFFVLVTLIPLNRPHVTYVKKMLKDCQDLEQRFHQHEKAQWPGIFNKTKVACSGEQWKRKDTHYWFMDFGVGLCLDKCFDTYNEDDYILKCMI